MVRYCSVYGCLRNSSDNPKLKLFRFPADESRCREWARIIGRTDLYNKSCEKLNKYYLVCDIHFSKSCIILTNNRKRQQLHRFAVPTLHLLDNYPQSKYTQTDDLTPDLQDITSIKSESTNQTDNVKPDLQSDACAREAPETENPLTCNLIRIEQTSQTINEPPNTSNSSTSSSSRKRNRRVKNRRLAELQKENAAIENITPLFRKLVEMQDKLQKNAKGKTSLILALKIYLANPGAYEILCQTRCLPDKTSLQERLAVGISTQFDKKAVQLLESKIKILSEEQKCCIISADEMSLKKHLYYQIDKDKVVGFHEIDGKQTKEIGSKAFVVMARGIYSNWEQPLAYCFLGQNKYYAELSHWLDDIISKLLEIGYYVLAFNSDQGSNFMNLANYKLVTPDRPYFFIDGKKIYYIFDVPHLTKSLRNNLMKYDFVYKDIEDADTELVASWIDIKQLYEIEKDKQYKLAPKLTESHVDPSDSEKKCLKYATQALSRSVAAAIYTLVETGKLPESSFGTTKFVELFNDTFDILNSATVEDDYKYKRALCQADFQTEKLEEAYKIFSGLQVINPFNGEDMTHSMRFIEGFLISINAILSLSSALKIADFSALFTRRLNLEALENFCGDIRQQGGVSRVASPIKFHIAFKKLFVSSLITPVENTDCSKNLDQILTDIEEAETSLALTENETKRNNKKCSKNKKAKATPVTKVRPVLSSEPLRVSTIDYRFEFGYSFTHVCGYLLKKCVEYHKDCTLIRKILKEYDHGRHPYVVNPPKRFRIYIKQMDRICQNYFAKHDFTNIGNSLLTKISTLFFQSICPDLCSCFPVDYLRKLFVRFRIYSLLVQNNKNFKDKKLDHKYISVPDLGEQVLFLAPH